MKLVGDVQNRGGRLTAPLLLCSLGSLCGMFVFGYNSGIVNSPLEDIQNFIGNEVYPKRFNEKPSESFLKFLSSVVVSIFALGGVVGGSVAGYVSQHLGRKGGLLLNSAVGIVAALLMGFSRLALSHEMLLAGRFLIGLCSGLYTSLSPLYISEVSPLRLRGTLGVCNQLFVTLGLLVAQLLSADWGIKGWDVLLGLTAVPCALQLLLLPCCPESPRFLALSRHNEVEAVKGLVWLRHQSAEDAQTEVDEYKEEEVGKEEEVSALTIVRTPPLRRALTIAVVLQLSQQLSGINGVLYYSTSVFQKAGLAVTDAKSATVGVGGVMVIMTLVSAPFADRVGRRALMLVGLSGMFVASLAVTATLGLVNLEAAHALAIVVVLAYVVLFSVGPGSIPWLITAELFSQGPRPAAIAIATVVNWIANFIVGIVFPILQSELDYLVFTPFSVLLLCFSLFTAFKVPETKQKTFAEIAESFKR